MTRYALLALVAAAVAAGGCAKESFTAPEGYVMLASPPYHYQAEAVSADGVYLGLRAAQPSQDGTLDFWATAVKNQIVTSRGYTFVSEAAVAAADGTPGKRMDFTANLQGREFAYLAAVWVKGKDVYVAEGGGPKEKFDADQAKLEKALGTVRLK